MLVIWRGYEHIVIKDWSRLKKLNSNEPDWMIQPDVLIKMIIIIHSRKFYKKTKSISICEYFYF